MAKELPVRQAIASFMTKSAKVKGVPIRHGALGITNFGYVMENGRIVLEGSRDELMENEDVKEFYMGLSGVGEKKSYRTVKHYRRRKRWL